MYVNASMSVFNKHTDPLTKSVEFKKHFIDYVFWDDSKNINISYGYENADDVNVFIPKDVNDMSEYVEPKQYKGNGWTLKDGDFIVRGNADESTVSGIKDLQKKYETFILTVVDDKDFGSDNMQHFELKGNKSSRSY